MSGRQREFYDQMIKDAKDCKVVPLSEALSKKDIQQIKIYYQASAEDVLQERSLAN